MFRKVISFALILALVIGMLPIVTEAATPPTIYLDGKKVQFEVPPTVVNGRTHVQLSAFFVALQTEYKWEQSTQTVTADKEGTTLPLTIGLGTESF